MSATSCVYSEQHELNISILPPHLNLNPEPIRQDPSLRGTNDNDLDMKQFKLALLLLINQLAIQTEEKSPPVKIFFSKCSKIEPSSDKFWN